MSGKLLKATAKFGSNTFISRVLGFVRDMICAQIFGAHASFDAFIVAFRIPNFMRRLFAEGAFAQAFVPVLSEYKQLKTHSETKQFLGDMMGSLAAVLFVVTLIGILLAPILIQIFAPGFSDHGARHLLASSMLRVTFPYLLLISLVALCASALNTYGSFGIPAFAPVFLNISLICFAVWVSPHFKIPVESLAWGVFVAGIVQLVFLLPFLAKKDLLPRPRINFKDAGVRHVLKLMGPAIFGVSVAQVNLLLDTVFASFLAVGSVSWLYYSERLMMFPLGIFGVAISTVILPTLSSHRASDDHIAFSKTLDWALKSLILVGVPAAVALFILAGPLLSALFQYHAFSPHDVLMARESLMAFSIGLPAFMLVKIFAAGFYSHKDIKTPVKVAVVCMLTNMVLNLIFIWHLHHAGIALATSLSSVLNVLLLSRLLIKRKLYQTQTTWLIYLSRCLLANVVMALVLITLMGHLAAWAQADAFWRLTHLLGLVTVGIVIYFLILLIFGWRPASLRHS